MTEERDESWRPVPECLLINASNHGQICAWRKDKLVLLKPVADPKGYLRVGVIYKGKWRNKLVHRLVAEAFLGMSNGQQVAHWNGIKTDNRIENLRYVSQKENSADAIRLGEISKGEKHCKAKLTIKEVKEIRTLVAFGIPQRAIATAYGITQSTLWASISGKSWNHVT